MYTAHMSSKIRFLVKRFPTKFTTVRFSSGMYSEMNVQFRWSVKRQSALAAGVRLGNPLWKRFSELNG